MDQKWKFNILYQIKVKHMNAYGKIEDSVMCQNKYPIIPLSLHVMRFQRMDPGDGGKISESKLSFGER